MERQPERRIGMARSRLSVALNYPQPSAILTTQTLNQKHLASVASV
jgi:hypothetical protein